MRAQMHAVLDKSRPLQNGSKGISLADLGFSWISMDDGWQKCNCSTAGSLDPNLPKCPNCKAGGCSWHDGSGYPIVDLRKFPNMTDLVSYGHSLGLRVGGYMNNCICMEGGDPPMGEHCTGVPHYEENVKWLLETGFDGISPSWGSVIGEAYATVQYNDRPDPFSHPGCWAYPDMQEIGNFPDSSLGLNEEKTHWGLWTIISAPLILGCDLSNEAILERIWPTVTNTDALAISDAWSGQPGTLVRSYEGVGVGMEIDQAECGNSKTQWKLTTDGKLEAAGLCLSGTNDCGYLPPPPTRNQKHSGCGLMFEKCDSVKGAWSYDNATSTIRYMKPDNKIPLCLSAMPPASVGGFYGGPVAAKTLLGGCPLKTPPNTSIFAFTKGEIGNEKCLVARNQYGPQLWAKPLGGDKVAALVINLQVEPQNFTLNLNEVPGLRCALNVNSVCLVRDVWSQKDVGKMKSVEINLEGHGSVYYIFGP
eukprot:UC4_evm10s1290